jgi:hypothetical protein
MGLLKAPGRGADGLVIVDSARPGANPNPGLRNLIVRRKNHPPSPGLSANRLMPKAGAKACPHFRARAHKTAIG